jgi:hypothetical protein
LKIWRSGLSHDVGEHVEAAAVRHADVDVLDAVLDRRAVDERLEREHRRLAAVDAEALVLELFVQKPLPRDGPGEAVPVAEPLGRRDLGRREQLDALAQPVALDAVVDVHELDADVAAVGGATERDDLAQRLVGTLVREKAFDVVEADKDGRVEVGVGEAVELERHLGHVGRHGETERIGLGEQMAAHLKRTNQLHRTHAHAGRLLVRRSRRRSGRGAGGVAAADSSRESRWRLIGATRFEAALDVAKVGGPRGVHRGRVLPPQFVHLFHVGNRSAGKH